MKKTINTQTRHILEAAFHLSKLPTFSLNIDLKIDGGLVGVTGPSGVGKTTLLRVLAGLENVENGFLKLRDKILFDTRINLKTTPQKRNAALVFQEFLLFPHLNVLKNIRYGVSRKMTKNPEYAAMEFNILTELNLSELCDRFPNTLSGGQKQRVAVARALLSNPSYILMDEPWSALDREAAEKMNSLLEYYSAVQDVPILIVSHDQLMLNQFCHKVYHLNQDSTGQSRLKKMPQDIVFRTNDCTQDENV